MAADFDGDEDDPDSWALFGVPGLGLDLSSPDLSFLDQSFETQSSTSDLTASEKQFNDDATRLGLDINTAITQHHTGNASSPDWTDFFSPALQAQQYPHHAAPIVAEEGFESPIQIQGQSL